MKICVIGLGYIGLPTALMLASHGNEVVGTDKSKPLVDMLRQGKMTFQEDGMSELLGAAVQNGIRFSSEKEVAGMYIICVPTPYNPLTKQIDPSHIVQAVWEVLEICCSGAILVIESTISPGTIDRFIRPLVADSRFSEGEIQIAHAPERIIPGNMLHELLHNSRTIGAYDPAVGEQVRSVYQTFCEGEIVVTDIRTAEMTKVVENTFRDINIAYANELMKICHQNGMDVYEIIRIANMHPRVQILQPGPGVGGHCISVDPWFLVGDYPDLARLIRQARLINDGMPEFVLERIAEIMTQEKISDISRIGLYGLTYKEDVDDTRESPTLQLLENMRRHLAFGIKVFDPMVDRDIVENQYHSFDTFLMDVDMVVVMVGHTHLKENIHRLSNKIVLDTRNICGPNVYKL